MERFCKQPQFPGGLSAKTPSRLQSTAPKGRFTLHSTFFFLQAALATPCPAKQRFTSPSTALSLRYLSFPPYTSPRAGKVPQFQGHNPPGPAGACRWSPDPPGRLARSEPRPGSSDQGFVKSPLPVGE